MQPNTHDHPPASAPCTTEFILQNDAGEDYLIQVSWPLAWSSSTPPSSRPPVPLFYLLDGNAHFFTALDSTRRALAHPSPTNSNSDALIIAIGYPVSTLGPFVFHTRRSYDFTPPCADYAAPVSWDGRVFGAAHGGADAFLRFVGQKVRGYVLEEVLPGLLPGLEVGVEGVIGREVLVGHSYGGLCVLHALFSSGKADVGAVFDTFVALSPTIWWSEWFVRGECEAFLASASENAMPDRVSAAAEESTEGSRDTGNGEAVTKSRKLEVYIAYGQLEQYPRHRAEWSDEEYAQRSEHALSLRTGDAAEEMAVRLRESGKFGAVKCREFEGEDHGSVAGPGIGWAVGSVLDPGRFD